MDLSMCPFNSTSLLYIFKCILLNASKFKIFKKHSYGIGPFVIMKCPLTSNTVLKVY